MSLGRVHWVPGFPIISISNWAARGARASGCIEAAHGNRDRDAHGTPFHDMSPEAQDAYLKSLESGAHDLDGVPSGVFFDMLLKMSIEGFFSDPVYGGNRNMVAWRMIGFPGAYASYYELVDQHGIKIDRPPMSLAEDGHGHIHVQ